jgi:hypothetical protein
VPKARERPGGPKLGGESVGRLGPKGRVGASRRALGGDRPRSAARRRSAEEAGSAQLGRGGPGRRQATGGLARLVAAAEGGGGPGRRAWLRLGRGGRGVTNGRAVALGWGGPGRRPAGRCRRQGQRAWWRRPRSASGPDGVLGSGGWGQRWAGALGRGGPGRRQRPRSAARLRRLLRRRGTGRQQWTGRRAWCRRPRSAAVKGWLSSGAADKVGGAAGPRARFRKPKAWRERCQWQSSTRCSGKRTPKA